MMTKTLCSLSLLLLLWTRHVSSDCSEGGDLSLRRSMLRGLLPRALQGGGGPGGPDDIKTDDATSCDGEGELPIPPGHGHGHPTPSPPLPGLSSSSSLEEQCFSADATVEVLQNKGGSIATIAMSDLRVGNRVWTGNTNNNGPLFQPVYAFGHWNPHAINKFLKIATSSDESPLEISSEHFVYLQGRKNPIRAGSIQVGDVLQGVAPSMNVTEQQRMVVESITTIEKMGLYAPLTAGGTLVVNGVLASCYVSLQEQQHPNTDDTQITMKGGLPLLSQHDFIHYSLSPFRLACTNTWLPGPANTICHSYDAQGYPIQEHVSSGLEARWHLRRDWPGESGKESQRLGTRETGQARLK